MVTPIRKFRVDDEIWNAAQAAGGNLSDVIREALERHAAGIAGGQTATAVAYVVRYQVRSAAQARKPWTWTETGALPEVEARKMLRELVKDAGRHSDSNLRNFQLVRREDYVVES